ncbi:serine hydrolase domain-containing protein [Roseateles sp. DB2]|uniref:serine hydrolase domain-containing protein n=1 Tax=Roseateles sp. DB2 TaxID=3453717 RepID=UPI003EE87BE2
MPASTPRLRALPLLISACLALAAGTTRATELDTAKIDAVFAAFTPQTPGCALGVYREGQVLLARGYGLADLNHGVPITPDTVFDIGSSSKQFTALAVLMLAKEGKLDLQDPVSKHLPEMKALGQRFTIAQMLHHTAGLRDYNELLLLAGRDMGDVTSSADALRLLAAQQGLNFEPGTRFSYSNSGYFLAAMIVERVSGQSMDAFLQERVFKPLGMTVTHVRTDHTVVVPHRATAYSQNGPTSFAIDMSNWNQPGDGAVQTHVRDLARWDGELARPTVIDPTLLKALQTPGKLADGSAIQYGLGLSMDQYRGFARVHHAGAWGGYRAVVMRFPEQQLGLALTCNAAQANPVALAQRVADIALQGQFKEAPATQAAPTAAPAGFDPAIFIGLYEGEPGDLLHIEKAASGPLTLRRGGGGAALRPLGPRRMQSASGITQLDLADDGKTLTLTRNDEPKPMSFKRLPDYRASAAERAALAGRYHSDELGAEWTLSNQQEGLTLKGSGSGEAMLVGVKPDLLEGPGFSLRVERDAKGVPVGMVYDSARTRGIRLSKR